MSKQRMPSTEVLPPSREGSSFPQHTRPLVSVVIPAYRCAQYLKQAVESVFCQSYLDYEIIVINDGSPDSSELEATLRPYGDRIRYFWQPNRGPAAARNRGIHEARGKFIAFLDSDDYWAPNHLARQMAMFEQDPQLELVYSDWVLLKDEKPWRRAFVIEPQAPEVSFDSLLVERSNIGTSTVVVSRATILRAGGFDESLVRCEDFEIWLRIAFSGARIAYHADPQVFYRCNEAGLSADELSMTKARIRVFQKLADTLPLSRIQRQMVNQRMAFNEAHFRIFEMKSAIAERQYKLALDSGSRAEAIRHGWKLTLSLFGLRIAPGVFRWLLLVHAWWLKRRSRQVRVGADGWTGAGSCNREDSGGSPSQKSQEETRSTTMV